jgi:hypothetical protein
MVSERGANAPDFGYTFTWWAPAQKEGIVKQKLMESIVLDWAPVLVPKRSEQTKMESLMLNAT